MVRLKYRYLLVNLLYPEQDQHIQPTTRHGFGSKFTNEQSWILQFRRPSSDLLDSKLMIRLIRNGIAELFGDYGAGMVSPGLKSKFLSRKFFLDYQHLIDQLI